MTPARPPKIEALMIGEEFREIPGFKNFFVSNLGRVLSKVRRRERILIGTNSTGYLRVRMGNRRMLIHNAVLLAFVGPAPTGMETRHLSGVRTDNRLCNLCYGTKEENYSDRVRHGRAFAIVVGSKHPMSKLEEKAIPLMREMWRCGHAQKYIAWIFGVSTNAVCNVIWKKTWRHV